MAKEVTEGREWDSFEIPGATVRYRKSGVLSSFGFFSERYNLLRIGTARLAFDSDKRLVPGTKVELQLLIPDRDPIYLLGHIGWDISLAQRLNSTVVVHFMPFCDGQGNPKAILEVLRELGDRYAKDEDATEFHPVRDHLF